MTYNIIGYLIFIIIIVFIIVIIGRICYRNGNIYVASLMPNHLDLCQRINKMLLIGYYLLNIGYATMTLASWETITSYIHLVEVIAVRVAIIISILCVLHYINIIVLTVSAKKLINIH